MIIISIYMEWFFFFFFQNNINVKFYTNHNPGKEALSTYYLNHQSAVESIVRRLIRKDYTANSVIVITGQMYALNDHICSHFTIGLHVKTAFPAWHIGSVEWWTMGSKKTIYLNTAQLCLALLPLACRVEKLLCCRGNLGVPFTPVSMHKIVF